eukprot:COSAG06_NODE_2941_length_6022_cov_3.468278_4_plen_184_part_00
MCAWDSENYLMGAGAKNRPLFSQLFLCLSRACLGKMIVLYIDCSKRGVFRKQGRPRAPTQMTRTALLTGMPTRCETRPFLSRHSNGATKRSIYQDRLRKSCDEKRRFAQVLSCFAQVAGTEHDLVKVRNPWGSGEFQSGMWDVSTQAATLVCALDAPVHLIYIILHLISQVLYLGSSSTNRFE